MGIATLAFPLLGAGCLIQPASPEEEEELRAEIATLDGYQPMDGEGWTGSPDGLGDPDLGTWVHDDPAPGDVAPPDWDMGAGNKPDPTPWVATGQRSNKPDPTPWDSKAESPHKPDPTPWNIEESDDSGDISLASSSSDEKPDPTPWFVIVR